jgi:hypothetical protein
MMGHAQNTACSVGRARYVVRNTGFVMAAKISTLVNKTAEVLERAGIEPKSIRETARRLQEDGKLKRGKMGRYGGAEADEYDAANLLLPILGASDKRDVIRASETLDLISPLQLDRFTNYQEDRKIDGPDPEFMFGLQTQHTFGEALAAIVRDGRDNGLLLPEPHLAIMRLEVSVERPWPHARIRVWGTEHLYTAHYIHPAQRARHPNQTAEAAHLRLVELDRIFQGNSRLYTIERKIGLTIFYALSDCLRGGKENSGGDT